MAGTDIPGRSRNPVGVQPSGAVRVRVSRQYGAEQVEAVAETPLCISARNQVASRCCQAHRHKMQLRIVAGRAVLLLVGIEVGSAIFVRMASVRMVIMPMFVVYISHDRFLRMRLRMRHRHQDT